MLKSAVDRKGKSDAKGRARPDYIAITLYRCRLMGPPNHAKRSMANMLEVCVQVLQLRWGPLEASIHITLVQDGALGSSSIDYYGTPHL